MTEIEISPDCEYEIVQEDQDEEGEAAEANQVQPLAPAAAQEPPLLRYG